MTQQPGPVSSLPFEPNTATFWIVAPLLPLVSLSRNRGSYQKFSPGRRGGCTMTVSCSMTSAAVGRAGGDGGGSGATGDGIGIEEAIGVGAVIVGLLLHPATDASNPTRITVGATRFM